MVTSVTSFLETINLS